MTSAIEFTCHHIPYDCLKHVFVIYSKVFTASCEHMMFILVMLFFQQIQTGLTEVDMTCTIIFDDRITARYIQVNPVAWNHWPAFRFELIGCSMYFLLSLILCLIIPPPRINQSEHSICGQ